jgi:hypothetical protein
MEEEIGMVLMRTWVPGVEEYAMQLDPGIHLPMEEAGKFMQIGGS